MKLKGHLQLDSVWLNAMKHAPKTVQTELRKSLRKGAGAVRTRAKAKAPRGPGGQHKEKLGKSIKVKLKRLTAFVYSDLWYSRIQEEGSAYLPGGVIKPQLRRHKRVKVKPGDRSGAKTRRVKLSKPRYWMQITFPDGTVRRVREVKVKGTFFMSKSLAESDQDLQAAIDEGGRNVARLVFGG